jgi:hypothetical protein
MGRKNEKGCLGKERNFDFGYYQILFHCHIVWKKLGDQHELEHIAENE